MYIIRESNLTRRVITPAKYSVEYNISTTTIEEQDQPDTSRLCTIQLFTMLQIITIL